ncbi:hypothetical protein ACT691_14560, partial [Vibrio metschnikovii]
MKKPYHVPPMTTGYESNDSSNLLQTELYFYKRIAEGGAILYRTWRRRTVNTVFSTQNYLRI